MSTSLSSIFQLGKDTTQYKNLGKEGISEETFQGKKVLVVKPEVLTKLAK